MENQYEWMKESDKEKEKYIIQILERTDINSLQKATLLGFKKTTVYIDGTRRTGYVDAAMSLFASLKKLIAHHKKYPLGFDFYYWGDLYYESINY